MSDDSGRGTTPEQPYGGAQWGGPQHQSGPSAQQPGHQPQQQPGQQQPRQQPGQQPPYGAPTGQPRPGGYGAPAQPGGPSGTGPLPQGGYGAPAGQGPAGQGYPGVPGYGSGGPGLAGSSGHYPGGTPGATVAPAAPKQPADKAHVARLVLAILCPVLVILGLSLDLDSSDGTYWSAMAAWAGFATVASLAQGAALMPAKSNPLGWIIGAVAAAGLLLFWTLIVLPQIATNSGFLITLGVAAGVAAVVLSRGDRTD